MVKYVVGFGDGEFLSDLNLTLVNSLKTLASEHVNRFCRKFALKQKHNWISFSLYVMQNNSDVFEHIAVGMLFRS